MLFVFLGFANLYHESFFVIIYDVVICYYLDAHIVFNLISSFQILSLYALSIAAATLASCLLSILTIGLSINIGAHPVSNIFFFSSNYQPCLHNMLRFSNTVPYQLFVYYDVLFHRYRSILTLYYLFCAISLDVDFHEFR